jgi:putative mRNA 3-end processing factor
VGDFYVDPWRPVGRALITHAHADHARPGSQAYLCAEPGRAVLVERLGSASLIETLPYGQSREINGVRVSFHPAGHLLGSAQIRLEHQGEVWVVSGDYKTESDPTCACFEPVRCHVFITESTFGLPVYRWCPAEEILAEINTWWRGNQTQGRTTVILAYGLGKAQRILHGLDRSAGPIFVHGAIARFLPAYSNAGIDLPPVQAASEEAVRAAQGQALVMAPPAAARSTWLEKLDDVATAFASGWMQLRGTRRRYGADRGFALSDHADWEGLLGSIRATGASRVLVTHGYVDVLVRWLRELGQNAEPLLTPFTGEEGADGDDARL